MMYQKPETPVSFETLRSLINGGFEDKQEVLCIALTKAHDPTEACESYLRAFIERQSPQDLMNYPQGIGFISNREYMPDKSERGPISSKLLGDLVREAVEEYVIDDTRPNMPHEIHRYIAKRKQEVYKSLDVVIVRKGAWVAVDDIWYKFRASCDMNQCNLPSLDPQRLNAVRRVAVLEVSYTLRES